MSVIMQNTVQIGKSTYKKGKISFFSKSIPLSSFCTIAAICPIVVYRPIMAPALKFDSVTGLNINAKSII